MRELKVSVGAPRRARAAAARLQPARSTRNRRHGPPPTVPRAMPDSVPIVAQKQPLRTQNEPTVGVRRRNQAANLYSVSTAANRLRAASSGPQPAECCSFAGGWVPRATPQHGRAFVEKEPHSGAHTRRQVVVVGHLV